MRRWLRFMRTTTRTRASPCSRRTRSLALRETARWKVRILLLVLCYQHPALYCVTAVVTCFWKHSRIAVQYKNSKWCSAVVECVTHSEATCNRAHLYDVVLKTLSAPCWTCLQPFYDLGQHSAGHGLDQAHGLKWSILTICFILSSYRSHTVHSYRALILRTSVVHSHRAKHIGCCLCSCGAEEWQEARCQPCRGRRWGPAQHRPLQRPDRPT